MLYLSPSNCPKQNLPINAAAAAWARPFKQLMLCLIGTGNVGTALLAQLAQQQNFLYQKGYQVSICAIANSRQLLFDPQGIQLSDWQQPAKNTLEKFTVEKLLNYLGAYALPPLALVDCTASAEIVTAYPQFIQHGLHIVTPNKKANVLPWPHYRALLDLLAQQQRHFFFEANVGAGLPIISTLQDLLLGGDKIFRIEGIFSGTLSYLFNQYDGTRPFSELVKIAQARGFTEPDPNEDLSGQDVARKLLILARQLGKKMELEDIKVMSLAAPATYATGDFDAMIKAKFNRAKANNQVLRYVGILDEHGASAQLQAVSCQHPLAFAQNSDNVIAFTTAHYCDSPLVIQGPGAGAAVTAMGVFADLIKLLNYLPE